MFTESWSRDQLMQYLYISSHLAYIIYQNIQSHKEKRMHISFDKNSNTEIYTDDTLNGLNSISH